MHRTLDEGLELERFGSTNNYRPLLCVRAACLISHLEGDLEKASLGCLPAQVMCPLPCPGKGDPHPWGHAATCWSVLETAPILQMPGLMALPSSLRSSAFECPVGRTTGSPNLVALQVPVIEAPLLREATSQSTPANPHVALKLVSLAHPWWEPGEGWLLEDSDAGGRRDGSDS